MKLDINYKKKIVSTNTWRLNNTFLSNQQVTEEIKRKIKKFIETNDNENTTNQNLWDAAKAVLRGKFIPIQSYLKTPKTTGKSRTNKQTNKNKISRRKEIIKI